MKCVVMEVSGTYAVVLSNGEFKKIKNQNYFVGQNITLKRKSYSAFASAAACLIIFCTFAVTGYGMYFTPDNYVSVDINPSIQLVTNRFDRIINVQSFNDDGAVLVQNVKLKNKPVAEGVERIIDLSAQMGYLTQDNNEVVIDVVKADEKEIQQINQKVSKYSNDSINISVEKSDESILELSKELGISVGRAKALSDYTKVYGGDIKENKEVLNEKPVSAIKKAEKEENKAEVNNDKKGNDQKNKEEQVTEDKNKKTQQEDDAKVKENNSDNKQFQNKKIKKDDEIKKNENEKTTPAIKNETKEKERIEKVKDAKDNKNNKKDKDNKKDNKKD